MNDQEYETLIQTKQDLLADIELLEYLTNDRQQLLNTRKNYLRQYPFIEQQIIIQDQIFVSLSSTIKHIQEQTKQANSIQDLERCYNDIKLTYEYIRTQMSIVSAIALSTDWQSPSFSGSITNQAGYQEGTINQAINDYKRDRHQDALEYEYNFRKEYIQHSFINPVRIFATNSGMSALTTIIGFLKGEHDMSHSCIAVGAHSYFENKFILQRSFSHQYREFDETDVNSIQRIALNEKPFVWFLDSLCNDQTVTIPSIQEIISLTTKTPGYHPYIVIDNTVSSLTYQPLSKISFKAKQLIVWESLLKHHQFGLDRVSGGIIYASCSKASELYTYRDHLGTNITDIQVLSLPRPNKHMLSTRLKRHERNHTFLAKEIQHWITQHPQGVLSSVVSPSLPTHPGFGQSTYNGAFFTLQFNRRYQSVTYYKKFLETLLKKAKLSTIELIGGSSFGLPSTRLYVPASRKGQGTPFFRVSVGMEPFMTIQKISEVFLKTLDSMK